ncbi:MAG: hypothetical protein J5982_01645 [Bacilli bacterium]|nr:hypothetical protein [Bacilli bacterium]
MKQKIFLISFVVLIIGIIVGTFIYFKSDYKLERDRESNILKVGKEYYEEYYYPSVGKEYVKGYRNNSIKIPLSTIENSNNLKDKINKKIFDKCDFNNTYIEIIPLSPYESKDYKTKVNLDC